MNDHDAQEFSYRDRLKVAANQAMRKREEERRMRELKSLRFVDFSQVAGQYEELEKDREHRNSSVA